MKRIGKILGLGLAMGGLLMATSVSAQTEKGDWAQFGRYADAESRSEAQLHVGIKAFGIGNGQAGPDDNVADGPGKIQVGQKLQSPVLFNS